MATGSGILAFEIVFRPKEVVAVRFVNNGRID